MQADRNSGAQAPPRKQTGKRPGRRGVLLIILAALIASLAASFAVINHLRSETDRLEGLLTDASLSENGWISAEHVKDIAQRYDLSTEILSRLFPDKIVYKEGNATFYEDIDPDIPKNPYDWDGGLVWSEGRPRYTAPDGSAALLGIDVSHHQKEIDWRKVAADGIDFAMIRVGYRGAKQGSLQPDTYFRANIASAADVGIRTGAYFFSQATSVAEAEEEADYVIAALSGAAVTMPVVYDIEDIDGTSQRITSLTREQVTSCVRAFCDRVAAAGYTPMIYGNVRWLVARMDLKELDGYGKWLAQYYETPAYPYGFAMWQYTATGHVQGIEGDVDMNLYFPSE
jgi:GH25 family lysozyme M1 (1,4-beta-N-acetylmuramidase)